MIGTNDESCWLAIPYILFFLFFITGQYSDYKGNCNRTSNQAVLTLQLINVALDISAIFEAREDVVTRHTRFTSKASGLALMEAIQQAASTLAATSQQRGPTK